MRHPAGQLRVPSASLFDGLAEALNAGSDEDAAFGGGLVRFLRSLARFDTCVVFAYRGREAPLDLFHTFTPTQYRVHVTLYRPGPYLLDPFFQAASLRREGFWRMRQLAPDRFFQSEYFRSYYHETGLAEEAGFFVAVDSATVVVLSLMRLKRSGPFTAGEAQRLRACEPVVRTLVARHWRSAGDRFDEHPPADRGRKPSPQASPRAQGLDTWHALGLTAREGTVVDLVLQGHSSESVASRLAIAPGTVKVHRRNVYRKLGISSQTELLALYIDRIIGRVTVA